MELEDNEMVLDSLLAVLQDVCSSVIQWITIHGETRDRLVSLFSKPFVHLLVFFLEIGAGYNLSL